MHCMESSEAGKPQGVQLSRQTAVNSLGAVLFASQQHWQDDSASDAGKKMGGLQRTKLGQNQNWGKQVQFD